MLSSLREGFYNFWTWFIYAPISMLFLSPKAFFATFVLYSPVGYIIFLMGQRIKAVIVGPERRT